jgi:hypothetical protein
MEEPRPSLLPIPASRKCRRLINTPDCNTDYAALYPPRYIPHNVLGSNIIWLDLFSNERDLSFVRQMVTANWLTIFDTAVECIDFFELCRPRRNMTTDQRTFSIIVSGVYVTDVKVVKELLKNDCVTRIYMIVNELSSVNSYPQYLLHRKIIIIHNNDPDAVMCRLRDDYSHSEVFTLYNNKLCAPANNPLKRLSVDIVTETKDSTEARIDDSELRRDGLFSDILGKVDAQGDSLAASDIQNEDVSTKNDSPSARTAIDDARKVQINKANTKLSNRASPNWHIERTNNTPISSQLDPILSHQDWKSKLTERQSPLSPRNPSDALALEKLEHIKQVPFFLCFTWIMEFLFNTIKILRPELILHPESNFFHMCSFCPRPKLFTKLKEAQDYYQNFKR